ncbi:hypothetical protein NHX12_033980 [Muraenolepis orangiensis]|uniref:Ig-like domain-containing protein n=1 Tax=Muraenolepis orangiensis TaxID=630683 RepID=A0A9Q0IJ62_9TELE|nr:hypothetical protein NHX12_033980 [Muraenolepis orangiensis]
MQPPEGVPGEKEVQLSLTFDAVEEADLGNYSCHVENHIGKRSGNAILQKKEWVGVKWREDGEKKHMATVRRKGVT